jgi:hypothetical protein
VSFFSFSLLVVAADFGEDCPSSIAESNSAFEGENTHRALADSRTGWPGLRLARLSSLV